MGLLTFIVYENTVEIKTNYMFMVYLMMMSVAQMVVLNDRTNWNTY
jgi:hypothetical protein